MKMKHFKNFYRKKENVVIYDSYRFGNFVGKQISIIEINNITECLPKSKNIEVIDGTQPFDVINDHLFQQILKLREINNG